MMMNHLYDYIKEDLQHKLDLSMGEAGDEAGEEGEGEEDNEEEEFIDRQD